jgi:hypothetical protein
MKLEDYGFGKVRIDGRTYEHDVIIDHGEVTRRKKKPSKRFRSAFGHTPLSLDEEIPWRCDRLVVGTGAHGALPIMKDVEREAAERRIKLIVCPTPDAICLLNETNGDTNAILHVTC